MFLKDVVKRIFRKKKTICKVYDTSAIRNYFGIFKDMVSSKENILIVVPEGVLHEISEAKRLNQLCRIIYNYITSEQNSKLVVDVTQDEQRAWSVDEQVIYTARKYKKKGYDVELVSCDKEQCFRAELLGVEYKLFPVARENIIKNEPKNRTGNIKFYEEIPKNFSNMQISLEFITKNGEKYLKVSNYISIYDAKGKRRIGRDGYVKFDSTDKFFYGDQEYRVDKIENKRIIIVPV